ncbi:MAG: hypothetical protein ABEJ73_06450 [Haloplanus sp.]
MSHRMRGVVVAGDPVGARSTCPPFPSDDRPLGRVRPPGGRA